MEQLTISTLDMALVAAYLISVCSLGMWLSRGVKTGEDLFLAGRKLPWWAIGASLVVSDIGAKDMVGLADEGYLHGMVMTNFDFIGCIFPVLIAAFIFMPYLWIAGVYTIPEYLGRRYNMAVRTVFALIWGLFMIGTLAVIFVSAAVMFNGLLGWNFVVSVVATAVLVGLYTTTGGLKAVVITDFVSCIVLVIGAALICIFGLMEVGGWQGLQDTISSLPGAERHFDLLRPANDPDYPWPAVLLGLGFVLGPAYWIGNQAIVQRTFGARSEREARASYVFCAVLKLVFPLLLVVPGLIGLALFHEQLGGVAGAAWKGGSVLPMVIQLLPSGVLGIVLGAFLAGVMSNLNSYVNSAATLWVSDIYRPFIKPHADDRDCLVMGRLLIVVFLVAGAAASFAVRNHFDTVYKAFQTFMSFFQGTLLALLLLGMLSRRVTQWGGVAGIAVGISTAMILTYGGIFFLWVAWWSFVAAVAAIVAVSLLTEPYDEDRLRGLVYWLPAQEQQG